MENRSVQLVDPMEQSHPVNAMPSTKARPQRQFRQGGAIAKGRQFQTDIGEPKNDRNTCL